MLVVNNLLFLNISYDFLFLRRFGFPYSRGNKLDEHGINWARMEPGLERHTLPLIDEKYRKGGTALWQPMIPWGSFSVADDTVLGVYQTSLVRANCMDFAGCAGRSPIKVGGGETNHAGYSPADHGLLAQDQGKVLLTLHNGGVSVIAHRHFADIGGGDARCRGIHRHVSPGTSMPSWLGTSLGRR
ncbi:MAG: hypothetical protein M5U22_08295 [Thermoleophilia bacterium]|nr:hypothetical protein [Thermoleophilia bacterium]